MKTDYKPPYTITSKMLKLSVEISEQIGEFNISNSKKLFLRKRSRIKTLAGTLQIEGNTLDEEQITAMLDGKTVLGTYKEIEEVKGAIDLYDVIDKLDYKKQNDLLKAHKILMANILTKAGNYRTSNVGVGGKDGVTHVAPPQDRVPELMSELFDWLKNSDEHPLIKSSIFHYEFEFIHPFIDGNGRIGRFWQSLILYKFKDMFQYIPIESIIRDRQSEYYKALEDASSVGESTPFIEFMLESIFQSIIYTPQDTHQDTPQDERLRKVVEFCIEPKSRKEIQEYIKIRDRKYFKEAILDKLITDGYLEMTLPQIPKSPKQKYVKVVK